jgi:predicted ArsR family transcriptional regulator
MPINENALEAVAALEDESRRRMYLFARNARRPVSREEVARAVGVSTKLAAFHLDKLAERGLLKASYARPAGRGGPGAGRSAKFYTASESEFGVTIPERRYDLAASILAEAVETNTAREPAADTAMRIARARGVQLGTGHGTKGSSTGSAARTRALSRAETALKQLGFEPFREDRDVVRLWNCPFHALTEQSRDLVCGMNHQFIKGLVSGLESEDDIRVESDSAPGLCCVALRAKTPRQRARKARARG